MGETLEDVVKQRSWGGFGKGKKGGKGKSKGKGKESAKEEQEEEEGTEGAKGGKEGKGKGARVVNMISRQKKFIYDVIFFEMKNCSKSDYDVRKSNWSMEGWSEEAGDSMQS